MNELAKKLFGDKKHIVVLAADHRYFGVVSGLEKPDEVLKPLLPYTDVLMTDPGVLRNYFAEDELKGKPVIVRASGCSTVIDVPVPGYQQLPAKLAYRRLTGKDLDEAYRSYNSRIEKGEDLARHEWKEFRMMESVENMPDMVANERLILHADDVRHEGGSAAAVSIYLGTPYQSRTLQNLAVMSRNARKIGLPILGVVAVGKALGYLEQDADFLTRAGAILSTHGADIVKTYNCGKGFEKVVEACGVPVIVAGGRIPKGKDPSRDSLELAYDSLQKGASGIDFGRRVWRHENPVAMIRALREIVHNGATVDDAYEKFGNW